MLLFVRFLRTKTFQTMAKMAIDTASAFIDLGDAVRPLLPLLTTLAATKLSKGLIAFGAGFVSSTKGMGGGGMGQRLGSAVAGTTPAGTRGMSTSQQNVTNALIKNANALSPNTTALQNMHSALGSVKIHLDRHSESFKTSLGTLRGTLDHLSTAVASMRMVGPKPGPGRSGFSGGGAVRRSGRTPFARGGRVPMAPRTSYAKSTIRKAPIGRMIAPGTAVQASKGRVGKITSIPLAVREGGSGSAKRIQINNALANQVPKAYGGVFLRAAKKPQAKKSGVEHRQIKEDFIGSIPLAEIISGMNIFEQTKKGDMTPAAWDSAKKIKSRGIKITSGTKDKLLSGTAPTKNIRSALDLGKMSNFEYKLQARSLLPAASRRIEKRIHNKIVQAVDSSAKIVGMSLPGTPTVGNLSNDLKQINIDQMIGNIYEGALTKAGVPWGGGDKRANARAGNATFDFPSAGTLKPFFPTLDPTAPVDAKTTFSKFSLGSISKKVRNFVTKKIELALQGPNVRGTRTKEITDFLRTPAAKGSYGPTDPFNDEGRLEALLMPGEMEIQGLDSKRAKQIAGGNLKALFSIDPRRVAMVPGRGNKDSVEADLAPGSFIVKKDIAQEALMAGYSPRAQFDKRMPAAGGGHVSRLGFKSGGRIGMAGGAYQRDAGGRWHDASGRFSRPPGPIPLQAVNPVKKGGGFDASGIFDTAATEVKKHTVAVVASTSQVQKNTTVSQADQGKRQDAMQMQSQGMMGLMGAVTSAVFAIQMLDFSDAQSSMMSITMLGYSAIQAGQAFKALAAAAALATTAQNVQATTMKGGFMQVFTKSPIAKLLGKGAGGKGAAAKLIGQTKKMAPFVGMSGAMGDVPRKGLAAMRSKAGFMGRAGADLKMAGPIFGQIAGKALVAVAGVELGRLAGRKVVDMVYGKETESKYATGVTGRVGMTAEGAGAAAGAASALGGIGGGAALGFALGGPVGALIGAVYGTMKAIKDWGLAIRKQAEFLAFEKLGKAADGATDALKKFNLQGNVSAAGISKVNKGMGNYYDSLGQAATATRDRESWQRQGPSAMGLGAGAVVGGIIGSIFPVIGTVIGAAAGAAIFGAIETTWKGFDPTGSGRQGDTLKSAERVLETFTDKMAEGMNRALDKISTDYISNLQDTTPHLAAIASLVQSMEMPDLNLSEVTADFEALQRVLESTGEKGKQFSEFLNKKIMAGMVENLKTADEATKSIFGAAMVSGIDITDVEQLSSAVDTLMRASGRNREEVNRAIKQMNSMSQANREQVVQQIAMEAKMTSLNRTMKRVTATLDAFGAGISLFCHASWTSS